MKQEPTFFKTVAREIAAGDINKKLWQAAAAYAGGDHVETLKRYADYRATQLLQQWRERSQAKPDQEDQQRRQSSAHSSHTQRPPQDIPLPEETLHARVLGLSGKITMEDVKRIYRERIKEYHPDKVASLGMKLREVAEAESKKINEAYEYFRTKYATRRNA